MGSFPSKRPAPARTTRKSDVPMSPVRQGTAGKQRALSQPVLTSPVRASPAPFTSPTRPVRLGACHNGETLNNSPIHSLQPVFVNGELAGRTFKDAVAAQRKADDVEIASEGSDLDDGDAVEDFLCDDSPIHAEVAGNETTSPEKVAEIHVAQPAVSTSTSLPKRGDSRGPRLARLFSKSIVTFGDEARDYEGVLSSVFERAKLSPHQMVTASFRHSILMLHRVLFHGFIAFSCVSYA